MIAVPFYFSTFGMYGNTIEEFICAEMAAIQSCIGHKYKIMKVIPVGNDNYALTRKSGVDNYVWLIYNCKSAAILNAFKSNESFMHYAIQNCLVINNRYIDLVTMKWHELTDAKSNVIQAYVVFVRKT